MDDEQRNESLGEACGHIRPLGEVQNDLAFSRRIRSRIVHKSHNISSRIVQEIPVGQTEGEEHEDEFTDHGQDDYLSDNYYSDSCHGDIAHINFWGASDSEEENRKHASGASPDVQLARG